jgi:hypothetical protein
MIAGFLQPADYAESQPPPDYIFADAFEIWMKRCRYFFTFSVFAADYFRSFH